VVIGITGSYGKTTVKELVSSVLAHSFQVIKTPEHINTEIGIARFILGTDFARAQVFVVEMGAYKPGDIATICAMVRPRIGILTAINEQHLALFGDIRTTQRTKYELLRALPADGLAVVNSDNDLCRESLHTLHTRVATFGTDTKHAPQYAVHGVTTITNGIEFVCNDTSYTTPLQGVHQAMNIAPVIAVATELGMSTSDIHHAIQALVPTTLRTMRFGSATIIDDSYNSNPVGFAAALTVLTNTAHGRPAVVVTRGMQELGASSDALHTEAAQRIGAVVQTLILISPEHEQALRTGLPSSVVVKTCFDAASLQRELDILRTQDVVILLENRLFASTPAYLQTHTTP
jgi:UDP-N-acetylmuramoyl-tripeptide--D-alanyl-D-alanine ligase